MCWQVQTFITTRVPLICDDWVERASGLHLWCGSSNAFLEQQQQRLMAVLLHARHDWDEGTQRESSGRGRAREVH